MNIKEEYQYGVHIFWHETGSRGSENEVLTQELHKPNSKEDKYVRGLKIIFGL